jgi:hypothetical protein
MRHVSNIFSYVISHQGFSTGPHQPLVFVCRIRSQLTCSNPHWQIIRSSNQHILSRWPRILGTFFTHILYVHMLTVLSYCRTTIRLRVKDQQVCKRMDVICQIMRMMKSIALTGYIQQSAVISSTYLMGAKILVECLGLYVQPYALYLSFRLFGISAIHDHGPAVRT